MNDGDAKVYETLGILSLLGLMFGLWSHFIRERLFLSEALISVLVGICLGPRGMGLFRLLEEDPPGWYGGLMHLSRLVLAVQIMAVGMSLPQTYLRDWRHRRTLAILLGPVMVGAWLSSAVILYLGFWGHLSWSDSLLLAGCVAPTDPILANSIVQGKFADEHVPRHLRYLLSAERYDGNLKII